MAWIESHQELRNHPKTKRLAKQLRIKPYAAIGLIHCLWWWAVDYAPDGDLTDFEDWELADATGYDGKPDKLKDALIFSGFLDNTEQGELLIHDWKDHAGRTLEQREKTKKGNRERQQRYRERHNSTAEKNGNANETAESTENTTPITEGNALVTRYGNAHETVGNAPTEHNITLQNITEHNNTLQDRDIPPIPPTGGDGGEPPPEKQPNTQQKRFSEFWKSYPKKQGKGAAEKAWMKIKPDTELFTRIMEAVKLNATTNQQWQRDNGQYIPNPSTWLNQKRWEDEIPKAGQRGGGVNATGTSTGRESGGNYADFRASTGFRNADSGTSSDG